MSSESTLMRSTSATWNFGITCATTQYMSITNQVKQLHVTQARFVPSLRDPGPIAITYDDAEFDELWNDSEDIRGINAKYVIWTMKKKKCTILMSWESPPQSWLVSDGFGELRGGALLAFARMIVSAVVVHAKKQMAPDWIEIVAFDSITPGNYLILMKTVKTLLRERVAVTAGLVVPKIMGPARGIVSLKMTEEPYATVFRDHPDLLDAWSVSLIEDNADVSHFNSGTFAARRYGIEGVKRTKNFLKWVLPGKPLVISRLTTNATRFATLNTVLDFGPSASEMPDFAFRLMDNIIAAAEAGSIFSWMLNNKGDKKSLYRDDGMKRPQFDALSLVSRVCPSGGTVYLEENAHAVDKTLKLLVLKNNSYGFMFSRPQAKDDTAGRICISVENPGWLHGRFVSTLSTYVFPAHRSLSGSQSRVTIEAGVLTIELTRLPYQCVVFGRGDVYVADSPNSELL